MKEKILQLSDGRMMGVATFGDEDGYPIIYCSGTPSSRFDAIASAMENIIKTQYQGKVKVLLIERPGYGLSSEAEDYSLEKWAEDVNELTIQLGVDQFSVLGISGGGPFALAVSSLLSFKVDKTAIIAGMGPIHIPKLYDSISLAQKETAASALHDPEKIEAYVAEIQKDPEAFTENVLKALSENDRAKLPKKLMKRYIQDKGEASKNAFGMINDYRIFQQSWPFSIREINVPLTFWHGSDDQSVPLEHSSYLAGKNLNAQLNVKEGYSHFSIMMVALPEVFEFLLG